MVKNTLLLAILYYFGPIFVHAQTHDNHGADSKWFKGAIVLSDGTEMSGFIRNNEKGNIVSFSEDYNAKTFESFRAANILSMEYFDADQEITRRFQSLATSNKEDGSEDIYLFEILREFDHFAVLSLMGRSKDHHTVDTDKAASATFGIPTVSAIVGKTAFSQTEEIYFINEDGERELYMIVEHRDVEGDFFKYKTDKGKVDDPLLPARYIDRKDWIQLESYVKNTNLKIDNKEKLLIFLDYYKTLVD